MIFTIIHFRIKNNCKNNSSVFGGLLGNIALAGKSTYNICALDRFLNFAIDEENSEKYRLGSN